MPLNTTCLLPTLYGMGVIEKLVESGKGKGITQAQMARAMGIDPSQLSRLKVDDSSVKWRQITALSDLVGTPIDVAAGRVQLASQLSAPESFLLSVIRELGVEESKHRLLNTEPPSTGPRETRPVGGVTSPAQGEPHRHQKSGSGRAD